jgi:hypothetical protein
MSEDQLSLLDYRPPLPPISFKGDTFDRALDLDRLNAQQRRVYDLMIDGCWRTLRMISEKTADPEASVSARLRDFRSNEYLRQFFRMESERMPNLERRGVWRYRLLVRECSARNP